MQRVRVRVRVRMLVRVRVRARARVLTPFFCFFFLYLILVCVSSSVSPWCVFHPLSPRSLFSPFPLSFSFFALSGSAATPMSVAGRNSHAASNFNWDSYDSAYVHRDSGTPAAGRGVQEGWSVFEDGDDEDMYPFDAALPMDLLENLVTKLVNQRVRKLDARLSDLQLEVKTQASELERLRSLLVKHGLQETALIQHAAVDAVGAEGSPANRAGAEEGGTQAPGTCAAPPTLVSTLSKGARVQGNRESESKEGGTPGTAEAGGEEKGDGGWLEQKGEGRMRVEERVENAENGHKRYGEGERGNGGETAADEDVAPEGIADSGADPSGLGASAPVSASSSSSSQPSAGAAARRKGKGVGKAGRKQPSLVDGADDGAERAESVVQQEFGVYQVSLAH